MARRPEKTLAERLVGRARAPSYNRLVRRALLLTLTVLVAAVAIVAVRRAVQHRGLAPAPTAGPLFVAPDGSDGNPCTRESPCASFDRAYHAARPGWTVRIEAGRFGLQTLTPDATKLSPADVVFRPATGASPIVAGIEVRAKHLEFRDLHLAQWWSTQVEAADVTFRNVVARGFIVSSSRRVRVLGGSYGPAVDGKPQVAAWPDTIEPRDILIDGVSFHDYTRSKSSVHTECLQFGAGRDLILRNSRFWHCDVMNVHFGHWGATPDLRDIVVENNFFSTSTDATGGGTYYSLMLRGAWENSLIRNNSATQPMIVNVYGGSGRNIRMVGNVAPSPGCDRRIHYSHNVWLGAKCSATDRRVSDLGFANPAEGDLHLRAGSPAIGAGDPADHPARDIDGQPRPAKGPVDAGADER
jgi:hypothetical protein